MGHAFSTILHGSVAMPIVASDIPKISALTVAEMINPTSPPLQNMQPPVISPMYSMSKDVELSLCTLRLSGNCLSGAGRTLASLLRALPNLDAMSLEMCALEEDDFRQLGRALCRSSVTRLDLADNAM